MTSRTINLFTTTVLAAGFMSLAGCSKLDEKAVQKAHGHYCDRLQAEKAVETAKTPEEKSMFTNTASRHKSLYWSALAAGGNADKMAAEVESRPCP